MRGSEGAIEHGFDFPLARQPTDLAVVFGHAAEADQAVDIGEILRAGCDELKLARSRRPLRRRTEHPLSAGDVAQRVSRVKGASDCDPPMIADLVIRTADAADPVVRTRVADTA